MSKNKHILTSITEFINESKTSKFKTDIKARNVVDLIKEAVKKGTRKVEVIFKAAYSEAEHSKLPAKLKNSLKKNKKEVFDVAEDSLDIIDLLKNNKDVESITWLVKGSKKVNEENSNTNTHEWKFAAENDLRNYTKNFDIDVDVEDDGDVNSDEYVLAYGGGEHYVIFKDVESYEKNKSNFDYNSIMQINLDKPIKLGAALAFKTYTEDETMEDEI